MFINGFLGWAAQISAGIVAGIIMGMLVKDTWELMRGKGASSILKIIGEISISVLLIGFIFTIRGYQKFQDKAENIGNKIVDTVGGLAEEAISGDGGK